VVGTTIGVGVGDTDGVAVAVGFGVGVFVALTVGLIVGVGVGPDVGRGVGTEGPEDVAVSVDRVVGDDFSVDCVGGTGVAVVSRFISEVLTPAVSEFSGMFGSADSSDPSSNPGVSAVFVSASFKRIRK